MKKTILSLLLVNLLSFMTIGCVDTNKDNKNNIEYQSELSKEIDNKIVVETSIVEKSNIEKIYKYSGTIFPSEIAYAITTMPGKVLNVNYDIGDKVNKDTILFEMDTTDIYNNINVLEASLASIEAQIQSAQTAINMVNGATMQAQIHSAKSAMENAELNYNNTKSNYDNTKILYEKGIISKTDFDKIEFAYKNAELQYNQAKENFNIISVKIPEENLIKAQDAYNVAISSKASIEAQIQSAQKSLEDAKIKSPIDGIISECNVMTGSIISQSQPQFTIINTNNVNLNVNVSENIINSIKIGDKVKVYVNSILDSNITGIVKMVSPAANSTGTYTIEIEINNKDGRLKSGMFGEVEFINEKSKNSFVVLRDVVISENNENYLYIIENNIAKKIFVETGIDTGEEIEITKGLENGMQVVIKGQTYLEDGLEVRILNPLENQEEE